jgi:(2Fe-2S) ferredoxin
MRPYERHFFICENIRDESDPRGCCGQKGAGEVIARLKKLTKEAGLKGRIRINRSGCLGRCAQGACIVVYPEAVWYGGVTPADADELFNEHVVNGRPVERLRLSAKPG